MQHWIAVTCLVVAGLGWPAGLAGPSFLRGSEPSAGQVSAYPQATLPAPDGTPVELASLRGRTATVFVCLSVHCPISNSYLPVLGRLAQDYAGRGVQVVGLNPNAGQGLQDLRSHQKEYGLAFPVLKDVGGQVACELGLTMCPEACVLDASGRRRYLGRIDDRYPKRGGGAAPVQQTDLENALRQVLEGKEVSHPRTAAVGCPIQPARPTAAPVPKAAVTYHSHVAGILQENCRQCHRQGGMAPFALDTYEQAVNWADDIRQLTAQGTMPPWKPVEDHDRFLNRRGLSHEDRDLIARWVEAGCPRGEQRDLLPTRDFPAGWRLGKPDLVLEPAEDYELGADGEDVYRCFVLPTGLDRDEYLVALEAQPANARVVRHVAAFLDARRQAAALDARDPGLGYAGAHGLPGFAPAWALDSWSPGSAPTSLPAGMAQLLPRGATLVMQVHYHRTGKAERDRTRLGLYFAKSNVSRLVSSTVIMPPREALAHWKVPAGAANHEVRGALTLSEDTLVLSVTPHLHALGKDIRVTATLPDGTVESLITVRDWEETWQETYRFRRPVALPAGTHIDLVAHCDNSSKNRRNPHQPPQDVRWGAGSAEEMSMALLETAPQKPAASRAELKLPAVPPSCLPDHPSHQEHAVALALCPAGHATAVARTSGDWSDPETWSAKRLPAAGARVYIPYGATVILRHEAGEALEWLRLEGTLRLSPTENTQLRVATLLVSPEGSLEVGSAADRVRPYRTAKILFPPRSEAQRRADPYDLSGGLIALGRVHLYGSPYAGFATPHSPLREGTDRLVFDEAPLGWKVADELLFPAAAAGQECERQVILAAADSGKSFTLSAPLSHDHTAPAEARAAVPVGNLTRNIVLASECTDPLDRRAHVMFMAHDGIHVSGVAFRGLGRTSARRIHTLPEVDEQGRVHTGDNLIGRYAVHYHLRSGASRQLPPQQFTGNVIVDSPKHGLVNHGGYVVAENNLTYAVHGSHFFAENGSEIGAFRNNLAVHSRGSGDTIRSRDCRFDFGHGGHGFWVQSPAVTIEGNFAFDHSDAAYSIFARPVLELGKTVFFDRDNLEPDVKPSAPGPMVSNGFMPFRFKRNVAGNSAKGLEVWNTNTYATHEVSSVVAECTFWDTSRGGIDLPYSVNTFIRDTMLLARGDGGSEAPGIGINHKTRGLEIRRVQVAGFAAGVDLPYRGHTQVSDCRFANHVNLQLHSPDQPGRRTILTGNTFAPHERDGGLDYFLADPDYSYNGDLSLLFAPEVLVVEDQRFPGRTVYLAQQHPSAVPFTKTGVPQLDGKTSRQLWEEYGLAVGGFLAPADAVPTAWVRGLVGPMTEEVRKVLQAPVSTASDRPYTLDQNGDRLHFRKGKPGERSGWHFDTVRTGGRRTTTLTYVDATPPKFTLDPRIKLEIHPDDVARGIEVCGVLHDEVAGQETIKNVLMTYKNLKADADGYVTVHLAYPDAVGNVASECYRFKVTPDAPRRGTNVGYYLQRQYASPQGPAAEPPPATDPSPDASAPTAARRRLGQAALGGGAGLTVAAAAFVVLRRRRRRRPCL
jgi:hypothetical protein